MTSFVEIPVDDPLRSAWLDCSDFGNGKRVVIVAQGTLLWIEELQCWAYNDGKRWSVEQGAIEAMKIAHRVIEHIDQEAMALAEIAEDMQALKRKVGDWCTAEMAQDRVKTLRGHAVRSGSAGMTAGMLKQARAFLSARLDQFDTDTLAYNVQNGTIRFRQSEAGWTVDFKPHDPADMFMQMANVIYDPNAAGTFWTERLAMLTPDAEQLAAMQVLYGYTLTGLTSDQAFYVHQGKGGDGKSMTHLALADLHGDYYRHVGVNTWLRGREKGGAEHRSDLVRLNGDYRFITSDEPPPTAVFDGAIMKQWTGGLVTARGANERTEQTFKPKGKLFIECNIIPRAPSDDKGFRRRFKLYQWLVSLSDTAQGEMPPDLVLSKLSDEKSGILNWLIAGCLTWLETRKIPEPAAMKAVLADYWADSSPMLEWMAEWCDTSDPQAREASKALYDHFKQWCEAGGIENIPTSTKFGRDLRDKHHRMVKDGKGVRWRLGIKLRRDGLYEGGNAGGSAAFAAAASPLPPVGAMGSEPAVENGDWEEF